MKNSSTRRNYLYSLPVSFVSGIILSWLIRSHFTAGSLNGSAHHEILSHLDPVKLGFTELSICITETKLPTQFCYDGFSRWSIQKAQSNYNGYVVNQYKQCILTASHISDIPEPNQYVTEVLSRVQSCMSNIDASESESNTISKTPNEKPKMPFSSFFGKVYDFIKFSLLLCIMIFQIYLCSDNIFRKRVTTMTEKSSLSVINEKSPHKVSNTSTKNENKLTEIPRNRKVTVKTDLQTKVKAKNTDPEQESSLPNENNANENNKSQVQQISSPQTPQKVTSNIAANQGKNGVIINCKAKGLVFDMTTKEGIQKWRDYVNSGKSHPSPIRDKVIAPTQVCLTPIANQQIDFSRISLYDHNGKAFRRIFVPGIGWITRDRCIQLMQEQGYKENQIQSLDY